MSLVGSIATGVLVDVIEKVLRRDNVPVPDSKAPQVALEVAKELGPVIENQNNAEPWYRSRVIIGSLVAIAGGILQLFGYSFPIDQQQILVDLIGQATTFLGTAFALYGRLKPNLKPLGK